MAAHEAALRLRGSAGVAEVGGGSRSNMAPVTVRLSPSQIEAINEFPLDSPSKMWMQMAMEESMTFSNDIEDNEWEDMQNDSLWDP
ncbi:ethylene-responsive transcription factor erf021 [Quercus suber]|uniref:Ethylene-responsive transcription factor erf021 n=1 Tax=Quercus suber TaxID=58331 RepID=A0AAW0L7S9_QUESU|nr:ethylene-responsive transcription factor [Quercus suber]